MSLFGALYTAVSGISAESQATASISNNIANVDTVGFKSSDASFYSLVTTSSGAYNSGTVSVNTVKNVGLAGTIQQTSSSTDAAISGNGFFTVKQTADSSQPFLYTRSGSFSENSTGQLVNTAGFVLYAWPLSSTGALPSNSGDVSSLVPCNVSFLGGLTKPTTTANLSLNLNADEKNINPSLLSPQSSLPLNPATVDADYTRGLTVYDSLGSAQNLTMQFRKILGPMASATGQTNNLSLTTSLTDSTVFGNIHAGDKFTMKVGTTTQQFVVGAAATAPALRIDTVGDLVNDINNNFGGAGNNGIASATIDSNGRLVIQADDPTKTMVFTNDTGTPLGNGTTVTTSSLNLATQTGGTDLTYTPEASITSDTTYPDQSDFPQVANTTNPNTAGWWEVTVQKPDGTTLSQGMINFNGDGSLNAAADATGTIGINLKNINWGNGSDLSNIDISTASFTQYAGQYNVVSSDQNGAALGLRTGVEITKDGTVVAQFSNGATANLYKVPLSTFANPDGLAEESGTAYSETEESGTDNLREAGTGGAGILTPDALEGSNVDIATEFANLIVTQRAYSANTRVVSTVDDMTQDLLRLL